MKILVLGSGGREHALCWKLAQSKRVTKLYCAPGNAGISLVRCQNDTPVELVNLKAEDIEGILRYARRERPDLVIVGPEGPLCNGIVDKINHELNIPCFGPEKRGAELEASKIFTKGLLRKHGIPTADYNVFSDSEKALQYVSEHGGPLVIKADGLAGGKGVVMAADAQEATQAITRMMIDGEFGEAGRKVLIEETLRGEETSVIALTDGTTLLVLPSTQDHKRIGDNDTGPNTGGMGAYSPAPAVTPEIERQIVVDILVPTLHAMRREDRPYKGVLYAGLMLTESGPKVLEFNVRFGDPECQAIIPRIKSDLLDAIECVLAGKLDDCVLELSNEATACVVMAAEGYPSKVVSGATIEGLDSYGQIHGTEGVTVFHGGTTRKRDGSVAVSGGRVLGVTATAATLPLAVSRAYNAVDQIKFEGMQFRRDIAARALKRKV